MDGKVKGEILKDDHGRLFPNVRADLDLPTALGWDLVVIVVPLQLQLPVF